jgi:HAD superfamily hydrolase (TIGR01549 family)
MDLDKIKAIFFDFGGTIDADGLDWSTRVFNLFSDIEFPYTREDVKGASYKAIDFLINDKASAKLTYKETLDVFIYWVLKNLDLTIENYKKTIVEPFYENAVVNINKNKKVFELLSKKYSLGMISNNFGNCEGWGSELGFKEYFKVIIDSNAVSIEKPDKRIFLLGCEKLRLKTEECIYVGDKYEIDIVSTKAIGMTPIWINNSDEKDKPGIKRIHKLEELLDIFNIKEERKLLL